MCLYVQPKVLMIEKDVRALRSQVMLLCCRLERCCGRISFIFGVNFMLFATYMCIF